MITHPCDGFDHIVTEVELHIQIDTVSINLVTAGHIDRFSLGVALTGNKGIADALILPARESDDRPNVAFA